MYKNRHEITELDKQIMLFSKNWFSDYLEANKIELNRIEILKYMIAKYVGSEAQYVETNDVYRWVSQLYCFLSDSGMFAELSTENLLNRFTRVLSPMWKTYNTKEEELILTLLGGISMTEAKGLEELRIELGDPDFGMLDEIVKMNTEQHDNLGKEIYYVLEADTHITDLGAEYPESERMTAVKHFKTWLEDRDIFNECFYKVIKENEKIISKEYIKLSEYGLLFKTI